MIQKQVTKLEKLAMDAYVYGFPLLFNVEQMRRYVEEGIGANVATPFNQFSHAKTLATPADTFVSINNDTVYSMAQLDLSVGPIALHVPNTEGRYYVLQFVDAWTNNFAYVGTRAIGAEAADFLLTPPNWVGEVPKHMTQIKVPTRLASIVGRWACQDEHDLKNIMALQDLTTLRTLHASAEPQGFPIVSEDVPEEIRFFERLRVTMLDLLPAPQDMALQASFSALGMEASVTSPLLGLDETVYNALKYANVSGLGLIKRTLLSGVSESENGWRITFHAFDYNTDFFEIGTKEDAEWIITDRKKAFMERAVAAMGGLWGNHGYEAAYVMTWTDEKGQTLNGAHNYTLTLDPLPPVAAFWSITMYNAPDYYLVDNPWHRYSIGDRTSGLIYNEDGSLTIYMSVDEPQNEREKANWLPLPDGDFRPILRMYAPDQRILSRDYSFAPIKREGNMGRK
ncbi:DUF1254 domain-containing protein [Listeria booriae]|uniref:ATP synthase subunit alpha n=1 Tax=Listeria booriae TaxID=1552123 RepID=A0A099W0R1_9LIST|nr:DUF1254 domain-containing protein [Listeria booriae]KGL37953.1 hypothetical protein EP57_15460 [Listeria booriae]STY45951.1 Uncharacterized conserved protein [Listeria booriae]